MGRAKNPKKFTEIHNNTPGEFYWYNFWSDYYPEHPSKLGKYAYNKYNKLELLEQIYVGKLKAAFDIWLDVLYTPPFPAEPTTIQKIFLDECLPFLFKPEKDILYDFLFRFIFSEKINFEDISERLKILLFDEAVPYTNFFEVSCYLYIIATRHFADENFDNKEAQFFRAMFEAINNLNKFIYKHETYLLEKDKEKHTNASRKGGENKYSNVRNEVIRLLTEKIKSDQPWELFKNKTELTKHLVIKVDEYIKTTNTNSPDDLFEVITRWSQVSKSDIALLYKLLVKESTNKNPNGK